MDNSENIIVSVCCATYNHAKYLEDCLEGFCNQQTSFKYEVLIHDDASTDESQKIIKSFEEKYPEIIKPIYQTENQFSQGITKIHSVFNFPRAKGKYIALCESDDFWCDPLKLEKQVKLLEANPDCTLSFHANQYLFPKDLSYKNKIYRPEKKESNRYTIEDVIKYGGNFMHTASMVFLKDALPKTAINWITDAPVGDLPLSLHITMKGNLIYCDDVMSTYRVFTAGSWSASQRKSLKTQKVHYDKMVTMWQQFNDYTNNFYNSSVQAAIKQIKFNRSKQIVKYYLAKLGFRR